MKILVPSDSDSYSLLKVDTSSEDEFYDFREPIDYRRLKKLERLSRLDESLKKAPLETLVLLNDILEGCSTLASQSERVGSIPPRVASTSEETGLMMKKDASFDKWDGEAYSWTPHFHFLKVQCPVYLPLFVTEEAPQRQRIRGYWIKCGRNNSFDHKEMLEECNKKYFDKIGAEKAKKKLRTVRQGESQFFRHFLQEWELQLEFSGGCDWPDSFKIRQLKQSLSDKLYEKTDVLELPNDDYQEWIDKIAKVAAKMESRGSFVRKGESRLTQYVNRSGIQSNDFQLTSNPTVAALKSSALNIDSDGDVVMGGMKIDLQSIASLIASLNFSDKGNTKIAP
ncbi:hypothetical protein EPUL_005901 [Erysiphe pulchra]|uniref:Retrotransposon gag domain-containing protein n=1 Tax=Erysiphe pulchra TaxID=225359 RepID=A0A2S4PK18_9PEZI|nr:hypothetical protein EPUL_005901 [Erysiphe pulchra]